MSVPYSDDYVMDLQDQLVDARKRIATLELTCKEFAGDETEYMRELAAEKARGDRLEKRLASYEAYRQSLIDDGRFNALYDLDAALGDSNG